MSSGYGKPSKDAMKNYNYGWLTTTRIELVSKGYGKIGKNASKAKGSFQGCGKATGKKNGRSKKGKSKNGAWYRIPSGWMRSPAGKK